MDEAYIGIDPGLTGCAVLLSKRKVEFYDFMSLSGAVRQIEEWLSSYQIKGVVLENPNMGTGPGRTLSAKFIRNLGQWEAILACFYLPYILVNPRTWQSRMVPKMVEQDPKKRAIIAAVKLFPVAERLVNQAKHNNRADALLMAAFCRDKFQAPKQLNLKGG